MSSFTSRCILHNQGAFDAFYNTFYNRTLKSLLEYDRENHTKLVQVYTHILFPKGGRRRRGKLLGMHRNSVLYHISRIEEITGIDFNDTGQG